MYGETASTGSTRCIPNSTAYGRNRGELLVQHGALVRLRVERQLGYKSLKYLSRIELTDRLVTLKMGARRMATRGTAES